MGAIGLRWRRKGWPRLISVPDRVGSIGGRGLISVMHHRQWLSSGCCGRVRRGYTGGGTLSPLPPRVVILALLDLIRPAARQTLALIDHVPVGRRSGQDLHRSHSGLLGGVVEQPRRIDLAGAAAIPCRLQDAQCVLQMLRIRKQGTPQIQSLGALSNHRE